MQRLKNPDPKISSQQPPDISTATHQSENQRLEILMFWGKLLKLRNWEMIETLLA